MLSGIVVIEARIVSVGDDAATTVTPAALPLGPGLTIRWKCSANMLRETKRICGFILVVARLRHHFFLLATFFPLCRSGA